MRHYLQVAVGKRKEDRLLVVSLKRVKFRPAKSEYLRKAVQVGVSMANFPRGESYPPCLICRKQELPSSGTGVYLFQVGLDRFLICGTHFFSVTPEKIYNTYQMWTVRGVV